MKQFNNLYPQLFPLSLTVITFFVLSGLLYGFLKLLNLLPLGKEIILDIHLVDILIGLTIYLKTAIDFALFIGNLMARHNGIKNRIAIELGTAFGNCLGTFLILGIWIVFKEVPILLIIMIFIAALVLLRMAEDGLEEYLTFNNQYSMVNSLITFIKSVLRTINKLSDPILGKLFPHHERAKQSLKTFSSLFIFSLTIPFLLGLDDFAGYIPLFSIINVFGFAIGVFLGHMLLNAFLFTFPQKTINFVKMPAILVIGSFVFVGLSLWGFVEVFRILLSIIFV